MAMSNTNLLQTNKPLSLPLLAFITMMIFLTLLNRVNSADSLSFTFNKFDKDQEDLILQGDATIESSTKVLQLTRTDSNGNPVGSSVGRALYYAPVRLWESSAVTASFDTTFTFVISSPTSNSPADGLTFFIASPNTTIPPGSLSAGALLGLFNSANALNNSLNEIVAFKASSDKVVAVEFDTYPNVNIGDPNYRHIGIDVNSIRSSAFSRWEWQNGVTATAHISYNSASRRLSVVSTYPNSEPVTVSYDLDLNTVLPEWVRVGFSGSTGQLKQINNILSWSFSSSLRSRKVKKEDIYIERVV